MVNRSDGRDRWLTVVIVELVVNHGDAVMVVNGRSVVNHGDWWYCFLTTRRSTSWYCVFLGNNLLSESSKRQVTFSRSGAEAIISWLFGNIKNPNGGWRKKYGRSAISGWNPEFIDEDNENDSHSEVESEFTLGSKELGSEDKADNGLYDELEQEENSKEKRDNLPKPPGFEFRVTDKVMQQTSEGEKMKSQGNEIALESVLGSKNHERENIIWKHVKTNVETGGNGGYRKEGFGDSGSFMEGSVPNGYKPNMESSLLEKLNDFVEIGQAMGYSMEGCLRNIKELITEHGVVNDQIDEVLVKSLWGDSTFNYAFSSSIGYSGGVVCVSDKSMFIKENVLVSDYFVLVEGEWKCSIFKTLMIAIYAAQALSERSMLWGYLHDVISRWFREVIIMGDFNEVRMALKRYGSIFHKPGADAFNHFITSSGLNDIPLCGYTFTWVHKDADKMSKLDQFLVSDGVLASFPSLTRVILDKHLSYHWPIFLHELQVDYGLVPFRLYHSLFLIKGFDSFVKQAWQKDKVDERNSMIYLKKKLQLLKKKLWAWGKEARKDLEKKRFEIQSEIYELDKRIDCGCLSASLTSSRALLHKSLLDLDKIRDMELIQKAKLKWAVEGDENSRYFHGVIKKRRHQRSIRVVLVNKEWIENPDRVKREFHNHFASRFSNLHATRLLFEGSFPRSLSNEQASSLEAVVTDQDIKNAVCDCGKFPIVCNPSFISLIPKISDAKFVKDFWTISLIGCQYKIVGKILANRLSVVINSLVSSEQSAFMKGRQILDGPMILNEVLGWCNNKKKQTMIFKVDFKKAFDSVRWEYLDDFLYKYGFGSRDTVQLETAMSTISQEYLLEFTSEYGISDALHPGLPGPEDRIVDFSKGKVPLPKDVPTTRGAPEAGPAKRVSVTDPPAVKECRKRGHDGANANAPLNVLGRDHADPRPTGSTRGGKSFVAIELSMGSTRPTLMSQSIPADMSDPDPLSFADPRSRPLADVAQSSKRAAVAGDPKSENTSFASMVGSPESIYRPEWGIPNGSTHDTPEACQDLVDHIAPPGYFLELHHLHNDDFLRQYNVNLARQVAMGSQLRLRFEQEAKLLKKSVAQVACRDKRIQARENEIKNLEELLEAEADMKKVAEDKSAKLSQELKHMRALFSDLQVSNEHLSQQVSTLQEQVSGEEKLKATFEEFKYYEDNRVEQRCAEMDARLDALSIDFDEELYPRMLTAIAGRRWMIRRGLRLSVMKCGESIELSQSQIYCGPLGVKNQKYPLVDQLEGLKDAPIDVIMAALHLESDTGDDAPQWVRELRPSSSHLTIPLYPEVCDPMDPWACKEETLLADVIAANVSRAEKKKKCRVICRTHGVGFAHHAWSDGVPVSVPTVVPQGLAILLADAATQTKSDEVSQLLRSSSLPVMRN
uniref:RNA-directed DNA polymerase, eukaryota n=1 Tax=Tanacetum cinerariifolium TaxID=118510 RepID=A0A6L2JUI6_TANCI|nr:RNA-directed DNA polymerase, eukaryota [Tanacetum cinerariifolium]